MKDKDKDKDKDIWDKFSIISSVLIPISISIIGIVYSTSMKEAEISVSKDNINIAKISAKVEQAKLVHLFLEGLTSEDEAIKKLAIKSVLMALPEEGIELVEVLSVSDVSKNIREFSEREINRFKTLQLINESSLEICAGSDAVTYKFYYGKENRVYMDSDNGSHRFILDGDTKKVYLDILSKKTIAQPTNKDAEFPMFIRDNQGLELM